jgi:hypothetical protein
MFAEWSRSRSRFGAESERSRSGAVLKKFLVGAESERGDNKNLLIGAESERSGSNKIGAGAELEREKAGAAHL